MGNVVRQKYFDLLKLEEKIQLEIPYIFVAQEYNEDFEEILKAIEDASLNLGEYSINVLSATRLLGEGSIWEDIQLAAEYATMGISDMSLSKKEGQKINENVMLETGFLIGQKKPILFISQDLDEALKKATDLRNQRWIKYSFDNLDKLTEELKLNLQAELRTSKRAPKEIENWAKKYIESVEKESKLNVIELIASSKTKRSSRRALNLSSGQIIDGYTLEEKIGEGGFGVVWKVKTETNILKTMKFPKPNASYELLKEAEAHKCLGTHENILLVEHVQREGFPYLLMEYFENSTNLREKINDFTQEKTIKIISQVANALSYAHSKGVVHADIKPENILVNDDLEVKVCDFGLAKILSNPETLKSIMTVQSKEFEGTLLYMSPEQLNGKKPTEKSDIFSLNKIFYELLTGKPLGVNIGPGPQGIYNALKKAKVDGKIIKVIEKGLEFYPEDRYQTIDDFIDALINLDILTKNDDSSLLEQKVSEEVIDLDFKKRGESSNIEREKDAFSFLLKGQEIEEDNPEKAIEFYNKAIEIEPNDSFFYFTKGVALEELGEFKDAIEQYDLAIDLDPEKAHYYCSKGDALRKLGKLVDAIEQYDLAIDLDPEKAHYYCSKGEALEELGKLEEANKYYDKAIELKPRKKEFYEVFKRKVERKLEQQKEENENTECDDYEDYKTKILTRIPYCKEGSILERSGKLEEALKFYERAIELYPDDALPYILRGDVLQRVDRLDEALTSYETALKIGSEDMLAQLGKERTLKKIEKKDSNSK